MEAIEEQSEIEGFLRENSVNGDVAAELLKKIQQYNSEQNTSKQSQDAEFLNMTLGSDFAVVQREQGYNSDVTDFVRKLFRDVGLSVTQEDVTSKKDAKELISFLKFKLLNGKKHNIVVQRWSDIPKEHYQYLYEQSFSILVVNELQSIKLTKGVNYLKHGPILMHAMKNLFKMQEYLSKRHVETAGKNKGNVKKEEDALKKYEKTYQVLVEIFQTQSRKLNKAITQTELVSFINENDLLEWELNQSLVSRSIKQTGNANNWKLLKAEFKTKQFLLSSNNKPEKEVIQFIMQSAQNSETQSVTYSSLYEFIFEKKWPGKGPTKQVNEILSKIHSFCIDWDIPIVNTLIAPKHVDILESVKQRMLDYYIENDGKESFEDANHFLQYFRALALGYDLHLLELLPEQEL